MGHDARELTFLATPEKGEVSALLIRPAGASHLLVLGHGASTTMRHATLKSIAEALAGEGADALRHVRMIVQIGRDLSAPLRFERLIHKGVEIIFCDRPLVHFTLRNATTFPGATPSISCCSLSRARDRRDITVPMGTLRTAAASA